MAQAIGRRGVERRANDRLWGRTASAEEGGAAPMTTDFAAP